MAREFQAMVIALSLGHAISTGGARVPGVFPAPAPGSPCEQHSSVNEDRENHPKPGYRPARGSLADSLREGRSPGSPADILVDWSRQVFPRALRQCLRKRPSDLHPCGAAAKGAPGVPAGRRQSSTRGVTWPGGFLLIPATGRFDAGRPGAKWGPFPDLGARGPAYSR
jgi:hypothetical protein